jgi:hypothetical protein
MRVRAVAIAVIAVIAAACGGSAATAPPSSVPATAASAPSTRTSGAPVSTGSPAAGSNAAIVGEWVGIHDCERIVAVLKAAKLDEFINESVVDNGLIPAVPEGGKLKDPAHPCVGAVEQRHSHFFTGAGAFGSKDAHGFQVDDGRWLIKGNRLVINDQPFGFQIDGDQLTLTPPKVDIKKCTTKDCRSAAAWVLMVAMPGMTWTRGTITP